MAAGWRWGALLIAFFLSSSALSRLGAEVKARRRAGIVAKGGARDASQVLANGALFALAALATIVAPWGGWLALGAGALAAASADTWGTEIGMLAASAPRLVTSGRPVTPGTSGGVTAAGLAASLAGAAFLAAVAWSLGFPGSVAAAAVGGGLAGALADSLAGALWQSRRRCARCGTSTEQTVHACGTRTDPAGGLAWLDNDAVNLLGGLTGALVALAFWRLA